MAKSLRKRKSKDGFEAPWTQITAECSSIFENRCCSRLCHGSSPRNRITEQHLILQLTDVLMCGIYILRGFIDAYDKVRALGNSGVTKSSGDERTVTLWDLSYRTDERSSALHTHTIYVYVDTIYSVYTNTESSGQPLELTGPFAIQAAIRYDLPSWLHFQEATTNQNNP